MSTKRAYNDDQQQRAHATKLVDDVNRCSPSAFEANYFPTRSTSREFMHGTEKYDVALRTANELSDADFESCFNLIFQTSGAAYKASSRGWRPKEKRHEMRDKDMKYLLVRRQWQRGHSAQAPVTPESLTESDNATAKDNSQIAQAEETPTHPILAFLSFMITIEDIDALVYIYEIHLSSSVRGIGLGKHLMSIVHAIGGKVGVAKSMLTVFTSNVKAEGFYRSLGYEEDEISPRPRKLRGGKVKRPDYVILSKDLG